MVAVLAVTLAAVAPAGGIVIERDRRVVTGYPRCTIAEEPNGWVWFEGDERLGVTSGPFLRLDGAAYPASAFDCTGAAACLSRAPELSGKLATILGTNGAERIVGTAGGDLIVGAGGDDVLNGRAGRDLICGEAGADAILGGRGPDRLFGGEDRDVIIGGHGRDLLDGGSAIDVMYGEGADDALVGGPGEDACFGGTGVDTFAECRVANQGGVASGVEPYREYEIEVEDGLAVSRRQVVADVDRILADDRSWIGGGNVGFRRVRSNGDFTIIVASPDTVDALCYPLNTGGYLSCRNGSKVILNVNRWTGATDWWPASIEVYREYLVNHEVGHLLGHGHVSCPGAGQIAPVMMQQTKGLDGCVANGWVYP
jgi:hypothetical protein